MLTTPEAKHKEKLQTYCCQINNQTFQIACLRQSPGHGQRDASQEQQQDPKACFHSKSFHYISFNNKDMSHEVRYLKLDISLI